MTHARRLGNTLATLLALGALAHARPARADPFHAQTLPLGQRAIGMGGAFTAIAADPSAVYYNPAGVVLTNGSALSASLTLTAFDRSTVKGGYRTENGRSTLDHNAGASLPVFVSAVTQLGRRDENGVRKHGIALSTFTVGQRRLGFDVESRSSSTGAERLETLSIDSSERTLWHALSYAYRAHRNLAFGLSGILSIERARYTDERISSDLGVVSPVDMSFASTNSAWTSHLVSRNVKSMLGRFGALYRVSDQLRLGVMFQPPSIHIRGNASVRQRALATQLGEMPTSSFYNATGKVGAAGPIPWELRLGGSYLALPWLLFSMDTSVYGRTGSKSHPVVAVGVRQPDKETGATAEVGAFYAERWYRTYNGNIAIGAEATLRDSIAIRAGIYTDLSSAPAPPRMTSTYQPPDVNRVGGSLSVGLVNDGYDISIGAIGILGRGRGLSFNPDPGATEGATYQRTHVTDRMFFVFLNGVRSAVRALAKKTDEKLREMLGPQLPEPKAQDEPPRKRGDRVGSVQRPLAP